VSTAVALLAIALGLVLDVGAYRNENPLQLVRQFIGAGGEPDKIDPDPNKCNPSDEVAPGPMPGDPGFDPSAPDGSWDANYSGGATTRTIGRAGVRRARGVPLTSQDLRA